MELMSNKYDVVIVDELFSMHGMVIAEMFKKLHGTPYIVYSPTHHTSFLHGLTALGRNYGAHMSLFTNIPESYEDRYQPSRFSDRLLSIFESTSEFLATNQLVPLLTTIPKTFNFEKDFKFTEFLSNGWFYMSEHFDKIGQIMPCKSCAHSIFFNCRIFR